MALPASASVVAPGLAAFPTVYYDRVACASLESNLFLYEGIDKKTMPEKNGVVMQLFSYDSLAANTTPATEGTPGAGLNLGQQTGTLTVANFIDYFTFSNKVVLTTLDDTVTAGAKRLAYRGALTVEKVIQAKLDGIAAVVPSVNIDVPHLSYFTAATSRKAGAQLRSLDILPKANGLYFGVCHSLQTFDLRNDAQAGGFIDLMKYTEANAKTLQTGIQKAFVGDVDGVRWYESNALPTTANYLGQGEVGYSAYVLGSDAIWGASLGKTALGNQKNFEVTTSHFDKPTAVDPARQMRAACSYDFWFGVAAAPRSVYGFRKITSESSLG